MTNMSKLKNDCLTQISSLTSLKDVVELSAALKELVTESESDALWEQFLPSNCDDIVSRSSTWIPPDQRASKKKLFYYLSRHPILLDGNTKSFALDETSGKVCYMLGSKALSISTLQLCRWKSVPESRFPKCAVLSRFYWLTPVDIQGKISTTLLSRGTSYGAYFVFKMKVDVSFSYGASFVPVEVSVSAIHEDGSPTNDHVVKIKSVYLEAPRSDEQRQEMPRRSFPIVRGDGWMEIEMGRYKVGVNGERAELEMSLREIETPDSKSLIVHGIEVRPLP